MRRGVWWRLAVLLAAALFLGCALAAPGSDSEGAAASAAADAAGLPCRRAVRHGQGGAQRAPLSAVRVPRCARPQRHGLHSQAHLAPPPVPGSATRLSAPRANPATAANQKQCCSASGPAATAACVCRAVDCSKEVLSAAIPLEKGYTQVDWLKLSKSGTDLNGLGGQALRKDISLAEVAQHKTADDAWMVLRGKVYNVTPYLRFHPGGPEILVKAAGKDATALFTKFHAWVNADALLDKCLVGLLAK